MNPNVVAELKRLADENDGILQPESVVEAARPVTSPLHSRFTWDNSKAAHEYRLWQARQLIRVVVQVMPQTNKVENVFVSLSQDRVESGYRVMTEVLSSAELRAQLLHDAKVEMEMFIEKYKHLKELAVIFAAMRKVKKKIK